MMMIVMMVVMTIVVLTMMTSTVSAMQVIGPSPMMWITRLLTWMMMPIIMFGRR